ncbi:MAG TPA: hypothetical protein PK239_16210 [Chitinophagales bacterium]|nr:hypothetical protein [Chitinophagales bacterium]
MKPNLIAEGSIPSMPSLLCRIRIYSFYMIQATQVLLSCPIIALVAE